VFKFQPKLLGVGFFGQKNGEFDAVQVFPRPRSPRKSSCTMWPAGKRLIMAACVLVLL